MKTLFIIMLSLFSVFAEKPKFCIDCKHYLQPNLFLGNQYGRCDLFTKSDNINADDFLVNGVKYLNTVEYRFCSIARQNDEYCGKDAKFFEERIRPHLPIMIPDCVIISMIRDKMVPLQKTMDK